MLSKLLFLLHLLLHSPNPNLAALLSGRPRNPGKGWKLIQTMQVSGFTLTYRRMEECQNGRGNSDLSSTLRTSTLTMSRSKGWPAGKLQPQAARNTMGKSHLMDHPPCLGVLGQKDYLPLKDFQEPGTIEWCSMKNGGTGHGPPEVCCIIWNTPSGALHSSTRASQMPCPHALGWQSV